MELTKKQFAKIEHLMPAARKPATISNYQFLCALLYIIENGCKWRALPKEYGNWHSVYMKFSRWSKNGTIQKIFDQMQEADREHLFRGQAPPFDGRAYEDDKTRVLAAKQGFLPVVPPKKNRREPWDYDRELYKRRNEVERYFLRLKRFRKVFTCYDKLSSIFLSVVMLAMIFDAVFM